MATVLELRKAGYSEEEIASWLNTERETLTNAGYNQVEQSNHFGIPFKSKSKTLNSFQSKAFNSIGNFFNKLGMKKNLAPIRIPNLEKNVFSPSFKFLIDCA